MVINCAIRCAEVCKAVAQPVCRLFQDESILCLCDDIALVFPILLVNIANLIWSPLINDQARWSGARHVHHRRSETSRSALVAHWRFPLL